MNSISSSTTEENSISQQQPTRGRTPTTAPITNLPIIPTTTQPQPSLPSPPPTCTTNTCPLTTTMINTTTSTTISEKNYEIHDDASTTTMTSPPSKWIQRRIVPPRSLSSLFFGRSKKTFK